MAKSLKFIIEALLFASDNPISVRDIRGCLPEASLSEIRGALKVLTYEYEAMGRSFSLKEVAEGYQLRTHAEYGPYILNMLQTAPNRLSRAAMETLSIIAYKQPILRQDIEKFRGVDVGGILRTLLEKGLIRIMGRKDIPGRPLIYGTTKKFLEVFDLKDLKSLPKLKEIKDLGADEFDPQSPEQLSLAQMPLASDGKGAESEQVVIEEMTGEESAPPPDLKESSECFPETPEAQEPSREEAEETLGKTPEDQPSIDETPEADTPTGADSGAQIDGKQNETTHPEATPPGALPFEPQTEETTPTRNAAGVVSHSTGVYENKETKPEETREEKTLRDKPAAEGDPGLESPRGDSQSEVL